jgi:hypothetical protein
MDLLTFECIAAIKVDSSLTVDRKLWCTFGRRECILGWYLEVDHNYVSALRFRLTGLTIIYAFGCLSSFVGKYCEALSATQTNLAVFV